MKWISYVLTLAIFTQSLAWANTKGKEDQPMVRVDLDALNRAMRDIQTAEAQLDKTNDMDLVKFERKIDRAINSMMRKTKRQMKKEGGKANNRAHELNAMLSKSKDPFIQDVVRRADYQSSPQEKAAIYNSEEVKEHLKNEIMDQVRSAGSVKAFLQKVKNELKMKQFEQKNKRTEYGSDDYGTAIGYTAYALLFITAIVLVVVLPVAAPVWIAALVVMIAGGAPLVLWALAVIIGLAAGIECHLMKPVKYNLLHQIEPLVS